MSNPSTPPAPHALATALRRLRAVDPVRAELAENALPHLLAAERPGVAWALAQPLLFVSRGPEQSREALAKVQRVLASEPTNESLGLCLVARVQLESLAVVERDDPLPRGTTRFERHQDDLARAEQLVAPVDRPLVLNELARLHRRRGDLAGAEHSLARSLTLSAAESGGEQHPDVAAALHELGGVLRVKGDLAGARDRLERSLALRLEVFGTEDHPEVAASLRSIGSVLEEQGRLGDARTMLERALAIQARAFGGEDHPEVAATLCSLADVLHDQGDLASARTMLERALAIQARVFGSEDHPDVADTLQSLALLRRNQGELEEAKATLERSLAIRLRVFGDEDHLEIAQSLHSLSVVLLVQGDLEGARARNERSLAIKVAVFSTEEHPDVARSLSALGLILKAQGDLAGARGRLERSVAIQLAAFGEQHPAVASALHSLASVLEAQGDLHGARAMLERCLAIKARVYGTEMHPSVASSLHGLAGVLQAQGDLDGAIQIYERVLEIEHAIHRTRELHTTGVTEMNLAQMLLHRGRRERAVELLQHALAVFTAQLPAGHPLRRQAQGLLAAARDGASPSPHMPGRDAAPFVLHALAVCGSESIRAERLQRIAFRVVLYAKAGTLVPLLLMAEQDQGSPGLVTDAPEHLLLPAAAPARIAEDWPGLVDQLGRLRRSFASDAAAFLAPLLRDGCIDVDALVRHRLRRAEPDDDDWRALFDEVSAVVQGADVDELQSELPLWTHSVRELLQRGDDDDSIPLARALLAALPTRRDALLAAWSDVLTDAQRTRL